MRGQGGLCPGDEDRIRRARSHPGLRGGAALRGAVSGGEPAGAAAAAGGAGRPVRPALHPAGASHVQERHTGHRGGTVFHHPQPGMLRRVQLLCAGLPPGADGHQPVHRVGAGGGGAADPRAGVQGVHPRRGRAKRQLPPHQLPEAEAVRDVQEPQLPGTGAVPQSGRGPLGVHGAAAADAGDTGDQAGVRAERHPVRLYAAGQGQVVL